MDAGRAFPRILILAIVLHPVVRAQKPGPEIEALANQVAQAKTPSEAQSFMDASMPSARSAVTRLLADRALNASANGTFAEAMRLDTLALQFAEQLNDPALKARCLNYRSNILVEAGQAEEALEASRQGLMFARQAKDFVLIAGALQSTCGTLRLLGEAAASLTACLEGLDAAIKSGTPVREAQLRNALALVYSARGDFRLALEQFQIALRIAEENNQNSGVAFLKNNMGQLFAAESNFDLAMRYYEESLFLKRSFAGRSDILKTLINIAEAAREMGRSDRAAQYLDEANRLCEEIGDNIQRGRALKVQGLMDREANHLDAAIEHFRAAIELLEPIDRPLVMTYLGETLLRRGQPAAALPLALRARDMAVQMQRPLSEWAAETLTGVVYRQLNRVDEAETALRQAIATVEDLRSNVVGTEQDHQRFFAGKLDPYRALFELLVSRGRSQAAFRIAEQSKARVLADVLQSGRLRIDKGLTADEQTKEAQLQRHLVNVHLQLARASGGSDRTRLPQLQANADLADQDYNRFQTLLYASHPDLQLQRSRFDPATPEAIARQLPPGKTAAIEYVVGETSVYAMVVCGGDPSLHVYKLPLTTKVLADKTARFARQVSSRDLAFRSTARELYQAVLGPADAVLRGKTTLVIIPDGPLWQVPFQALESSQGHYLIEDAAVLYAPSMTIMSEFSRRYPQPRVEHSVLALGNPSRTGLPALPSAEKEVLEVGRIYGNRHSMVLRGDQAGKTALKENASRYSLLHLATHGVLDAKNPMHSHVVLSPHGDDGGLLEAWEILGYEFKFDAVILSACEMANGKVGQGEGLLGMSWALFVAGTPTTVASLWKVDSSATSDLMIEFHRRLRSGTGKAESLRQATLRAITSPEFRHPFYWAGFVMLGQGL